MTAGDARAPIGVFDSGVGGLTVLAALRMRLPHERFVYLGDTARLPYGTKTGGTVARYALQAARCLMRRDVKMIVVACNTASAVAIEPLAAAKELAGVPVVGVVEPGAAAAVAQSRTGRIAVLGTESTIVGGAYDRAIARRRAEAIVTGRPCPLFVALAEEGWVTGDVPRAVAETYVADLVQAGARDGRPDHDTVVLGCTHFPVLREVIASVAGPDVALVDSAETTADVVATRLEEASLSAPGAVSSPTPVLLATDGAERFARVGARFLGLPLRAADVEVVDL
ncbi:MAG: glutamate racemase [Myxococcota bacterium]